MLLKVFVDRVAVDQVFETLRCAEIGSVEHDEDGEGDRQGAEARGLARKSGRKSAQ